MKTVSADKYIEKLECDVFPITFIKFLLNKKKILSYFAKAAGEDFELRAKYKIDTSDCEICKSKKDEGILCRKHTSIHRVLTANDVAFDLDTNAFFYKNEIFRMVGKRLVIIYCPHPKLITGEISDEKVRKVNPITIEDPELTELPRYEKIHEFISSELMDQNLKAWFNREFSIITIPEDRNNQNWCLVANN
jgi:hypothetical protein